MKTYVITLSKTFPKGHCREGDSTHFKEEFLLGQNCPQCQSNKDITDPFSFCNVVCSAGLRTKIHTIRANYPLWADRISKIQQGEACLSVRQWTGKPYRSTQEEILKLTAKDGVGIQKLILTDLLAAYAQLDDKRVELINLANNDGLSFPDWVEWFKDYDLSQPLAVIHFTNFRYNKI